MTQSYWRTERLIVGAVERRILGGVTISDRTLSVLTNPDLLGCGGLLHNRPVGKCGGNAHGAKFRWIRRSTPANALGVALLAGDFFGGAFPRQEICKYLDNKAQKCLRLRLPWHNRTVERLANR